MLTTSKSSSTSYPYDTNQFAPSLVEARQPASGTPQHDLAVGIVVKDSPDGKRLPQLADRQTILVVEGGESFDWRVDSLRSLFRGDKPAPSLSDVPPNEYMPHLLHIERHVLEVSECIGDRRDAEMKEIFSALRRRPDGKSMGFVHDYMWQVAALLLGTCVLSQAEFEALMSRLERSCRTFEVAGSSRNYVATLRMTIEPMGSARHANG